MRYTATALTRDAGCGSKQWSRTIQYSLNYNIPQNHICLWSTSAEQCAAKVGQSSPQSGGSMAVPSVRGSTTTPVCSKWVMYAVRSVHYVMLKHHVALVRLLICSTYITQLCECNASRIIVQAAYNPWFIYVQHNCFQLVVATMYNTQNNWVHFVKTREHDFFPKSLCSVVFWIPDDGQIPKNTKYFSG